MSEDTTPAATTTDGEVKSYGFLLVPRFAMLAFTSAVEPLRAANLLSGKTLYRWKTITVDGEPVAASRPVSAKVISQSSSTPLWKSMRCRSDMDRVKSAERAR